MKEIKKIPASPEFSALIRGLNDEIDLIRADYAKGKISMQEHDVKVGALLARRNKLLMAQFQKNLPEVIDAVKKEIERDQAAKRAGKN